MSERPMASNVSEQLDKGEKFQPEFGDSGFLSGTNLNCSEEVSSELELEAPQSVETIAPEPPMRALDSGLDLGLSENLGQLSLTHGTINSLNKIHCEPRGLPLVSFTDASTLDSCIDNNQATNIPQEPWQLYYSQDIDGDTQLHIAVVQGYVEATFCLINMAPHPCLLDIFNDEGHTALHLSVLTHQPRISRCLVLAGANLESRNNRGNTPLHLACACGDIDSARALTDPLSPGERSILAHGKIAPALPQNLEQRNFNGEMCIHLAASGNHVELMRLLLRLGADLDAREGLSGRTALHLAIENGCQAVLKFLLHECKPRLDIPNYAGYTAYQIALCVNTQLATDLIRFGAKPEPLSDNEADNSSDEEDTADETDEENVEGDFLYPLSPFEKSSLLSAFCA